MTRQDFEEYIERYANQHAYTIEEARKHALFREDENDIEEDNNEKS